MNGIAKETHDSAVTALQRDYQAALAKRPPGGSIRLQKSTSNLFRFGQRTGIALNVDAFTGVIDVDSATATADVQGMTTYEDLVAATLPHGLMPTVVPQLKTITLGGAITGLGIESTSIHSGLPHEAVRELEILTGSGDIITATGTQNDDLFRTFPNSYGTLGYALRARIDLAPVQPFVTLRHERFTSASACAAAITEYQAAPPDFLDGTVFSPTEMYLTVGEFTATASTKPSDYTGRNIFYRSITERETDLLNIADYLWRWDTDWFWCSRAFGAQQPVIRALWPKRWLRSDIYHRMVRWDRRFGFSSKLDRIRGRGGTELVIQDVEIPVSRLDHFLSEFDRVVGIRPVWLCPVRTQQNWPLYPLTNGELYVNVGFWSGVRARPSDPSFHNRFVEELVTECGGHKSLYSTVHYGEEEFWRHYNGAAYWPVKERYDPDGVLPDLYSKCVQGNKGA